VSISLLVMQDHRPLLCQEALSPEQARTCSRCAIGTRGIAYALDWPCWRWWKI